jgi:hypothetical protein
LPEEAVSTLMATGTPASFPWLDRPALNLV